MKLYLEDNEEYPAVQYLPDADPAPANHTITTNPRDWDVHKNEVDVPYSDFRNEMIDQFEANWGTHDEDNQKALIENYIYPSETPTSELDDLYDEDDRDYYHCLVVEMLNGPLGHHVLKSSESKKHFIIRVDDSGTLSSVEIKSDTKI